MGATNCPETPRQKMIGMMYLFLTAMLALNVSKEILNAFVVVNEGLVKTNTNFDLRNGFTYQSLAFAKGNDPKKVTPYYDAAEKVKKLSSDLDAYIRSLKLQIIMKADGSTEAEAEGKVEDMMKFEAKDNRDVPHLFMLGEAGDGSQGEARNLKNKLIEFKKNALDVLNDPNIILNKKDTVIKKLGNLGINTDDEKEFDPDKPEERFWETKLFAEIPCAATLTLLTQIQNQVKNAEASVIQTLLGGIGSTDIKFDVVAPRVIPKSNYIIQGDSYEAELFIAAYSSTDTTSQVIIGSAYDSVKNEIVNPVETINFKDGIGRYKVPNAGGGSHTYAAMIKVFNPTTGEKTNYPVKSGGKYNIEYTVAPPMAVVSPTKMNVLYIGVDNPMEISVPGFRDDQVTASCSGGSLIKSGKGWVARVTKVGKCNISVSAKDDKGGSKSMGTKEFRVKRVPDPVATCAGSKGGPIAKSLLQAQNGVAATLENFDFDLKFNVTTFTVSALIGGFERSATSTGSRFTQEQLNIIQKVDKGKKVFIENVKATGPDGTVRNLGSIVFKVN